jgi:hypothetical protein
MSKNFTYLSDVVGLPQASATSQVTLTFPAGGDPGAGVMDVLRILVKKGSAAATLAEMRAGIREMELYFGTQPVQSFKASELFMEQICNGETPVDGILDIPFAEQWRALVTDEAVLAPDLRRYPKVQLKFYVVNGATPFEFYFAQEYRTDQKENPVTKAPIVGMIGKTMQITDVSGGLPQVKIDPLNGRLQRMFIEYPSTAVLTRVTLKQGEVTIYDVIETAAIKGLTAQLRPFKMVIPPAATDFSGTFKTWPVILDNNQRLAEALENPIGLKLILEIDTASTIRIQRQTQLALG